MKNLTKAFVFSFIATGLVACAYDKYSSNKYHSGSGYVSTYRSVGASGYERNDQGGSNNGYNNGYYSQQSGNR